MMMLNALAPMMASFSPMAQPTTTPKQPTTADPAPTAPAMPQLQGLSADVFTPSIRSGKKVPQNIPFNQIKEKMAAEAEAIAKSGDNLLQIFIKKTTNDNLKQKAQQILEQYGDFLDESKIQTLSTLFKNAYSAGLDQKPTGIQVREKEKITTFVKEIELELEQLKIKNEKATQAEQPQAKKTKTKRK
jgi:hypothetical protein